MQRCNLKIYAHVNCSKKFDSYRKGSRYQGHGFGELFLHILVSTVIEVASKYGLSRAVIIPAENSARCVSHRSAFIVSKLLKSREHCY